MNKNVYQKFLDYIKKVGRPLSEINLGSSEYGLKPEDALKVIELLKTENVPILGGDVLVEQDGRLEYTYVNWYLDILENQNKIEYAGQSYVKAQEAISPYVNRVDKKYYIVIVI